MVIDLGGKLDRESAERASALKRSAEASAENAAKTTKASACAGLCHERSAYCMATVQLVPPAGSFFTCPEISMQKPLWPVLPTACGTAVTS